MSKFDTATFEEALSSILFDMENDQRAYDEYLKDRTRSKEDLQVVHMKAFFELIAFNTMRKLVPDYIPGDFVGKKLAQELSTVGDFVSVVGGQVAISPAYSEFLLTKEKYLKSKTN